MPKLVNLGSLCIDHVYRVDHITNAGETIASQSHDVFPGGKGSNQSLAAARAGASVSHFGCIGKDGGMLRDVLIKAGVNVEGLRTCDTATGHAVIQVDGDGQNAIVIAGGANRRLTGADIDSALNSVDDGDWLLLQNEVNDLPMILNEAYQRNLNVAFNIAPVDGREQDYVLDGLSLLIVNEIEAAAVSGITEPAGSLAAICRRYPNLEVVLTLGRDGVMYGHNSERMEMRAFEVNAVDETAAGDAFIGYLMASLVKGERMDNALHKASAAGALAVTQPGAASSIPANEKVIEFLESRGEPE